ncbi:hypothetical protein ACW14X_24005 [Nocardioides sp. YJ-D4]
MTLVAKSSDPSPDESSDTADTGTSRIYVTRVAIALIRLPPGQEAIFTSPEATALARTVDGKLRSALSSDTRVSEVLENLNSREIDNARTLTFYDPKYHEADFVKAIDDFEALRLNALISFRVRVPAKNQPKYRSMDDVPSDEYLVVWDGVSLAIQWEQKTARATGSGGHVIFDILEDVGRAAGYPVQIMACSPGCKHKFMHADIVTFDHAHRHREHFHVGGRRSPVGSTVVAPYRFDPDDRKNLLRTYNALHSALNAFASTQSLADYLLFLEWRARRDAAAVLEISYDRAARPRFPRVIAMTKTAWKHRGDHKEARQLIAGLWLALATVEAARGDWVANNRALVDRLETGDLSELQEFFDPGTALVEHIDLSLVRASLEEAASRAEGRALVYATLAGACAAIAGSAVTSLLT